MGLKCLFSFFLFYRGEVLKQGERTDTSFFPIIHTHKGAPNDRRPFARMDNENYVQKNLLTSAFQQTLFDDLLGNQKDF